MREGKSQIGQTTQEKCSENFWTQTITDCELAQQRDVVFDKLCLWQVGQERDEEVGGD